MPGVGLKAEAVIEMLAGRFVAVAHGPSSSNPLLWGKAVQDERYALGRWRGGEPGDTRISLRCPKNRH